MEVGRSGSRIGVLVPCRNEARVIARRLRNLAACDWPVLVDDGAERDTSRAAARARMHTIVVVDDGSDDATSAIASDVGTQLFGARRDVELVVVRNSGAAGKSGAIHTGLAELGAHVDLVVLSDADVVLEPTSLVELARAFERDPRLALACAAQRFVVDLADDGTCSGADGGALRDASGAYDRWTARIRAFESRRGLLYSVHGQCLAWRGELGLAPRAGFAADDLDLMLQARASGARIELVPSARFCEQKTPAGARREQQALRRARAYLQCVRDERGRDAAAFAQCQRLLYRHAPSAAPWIALAAALGAPLAAWSASGVALAELVLGAELLVLATAPGWRLAALLVTIARAQRLERRGAVSDRWEMARS